MQKASSPPLEAPAPTAARAEGPPPERRVAVNSGLLLVSFGFQALVSLVLVGIVARYLGQAGLGRYGYVVSFIELFIALVDMGMNRILVREISRNREEADRYTSAIWTLRLLLSLIVMAVVAVAASGSGGRDLWLAIMVYYVSQVLWLLGDVFNGVFHANQRMEYQFWTLNANQVLLLVLTLGVVWLNLGLVALFAVRVVANFVKLVWVWRISDRRFAHAHVMWGVLPGAWAALHSLPAAIGVARSRGKAEAREFLAASGASLGRRWQDTLLAWHMLVESLPVGISLLLRSYIWRAGVVLTVVWLGQAEGDLVNGVLYGPLRAVQQLRIVPAAFSAAMLPVFSNRAAGRMDEFDSAFAKSIKLFTAISLLIALSFTFLADPLVLLLLGSGIDLETAAQVLIVLGWVIVLYFPNWLYGMTLVALGRQRLETVGLALGLAAGYLVARWLIPVNGAMGVSFAILAAEAVFFAIGTAAMWRHFRWRQLAPGLFKIVVACGVAGLAFALGHWVRQQFLAELLARFGSTVGALLEVIVLGGLGLLVFVGMLWLLRAFDPDEMEGIRAMFRLRRGKRA